MFSVLLENKIHRWDVFLKKMFIWKVFSFREFMLQNAAVIVNGKGLCSQVDFTCVLIAHLSWHIMFGSFSHCCSMNNPQKPDQKRSLTVLLTVLLAKGHLWADDLLVQWTRWRATIFSRCQIQRDWVLCLRLCSKLPMQLGNSPRCQSSFRNQRPSCCLT